MYIQHIKVTGIAIKVATQLVSTDYLSTVSMPTKPRYEPRNDEPSSLQIIKSLFVNL